MKVPEMTIHAKGREIVLRTATEQDAQMLIDYLKKTCAETRFLAKEPEEIQMTVEQEEQFIKRTNDSQTDLMLLAFLNGTFIGNCSFTGVSTSRYRHRATMGIGRAMIEKLLEIAKEKGYEQMELEVVADNQRAIRLYESIGFQMYGKLPDNMKYLDGTYADAYWMMRKL